MTTPRKKAPVKKAAPRKKVSSVKKAPAKKVAASSSRSGTRVTRPADVSSRVVDEIPKDGRGNVKTNRYRDTLAAIRKDVGAGKPVVVAEFVGKAGAALARRELHKGTLLCDGDVEDWEFTSRRVSDGSVLYAELIG